MNQENIIATRKNKVIYREGDNCIKLFDKELYQDRDFLCKRFCDIYIDCEQLDVESLVIKINGLDSLLSYFIVAEKAWRKKSDVYREDCIIALYKIMRQIKIGM